MFKVEKGVMLPLKQSVKSPYFLLDFISIFLVYVMIWVNVNLFYLLFHWNFRFLKFSMLHVFKFVKILLVKVLHVSVLIGLLCMTLSLLVLGF